jgi:biotin carboxylase
MSRTLLIAGAGFNQAPIIRRAREMGIRTIAADGNPDAEGLSLADACAVVDITHGDALARLAAHHGADGIYPASEWSIEACAAARERLGLPGVAPEVALRMRDKAAMRESLAAAGVPCPAFACVHTPDEAREALLRTGLPAIVKPADGNASRGARKVAAADRLADAFDTARRQSRSGAVLVESFLEGPEYGVDGLVYAGAYTLGGISEYVRSAPPYAYNHGLFMPPACDGAAAAAMTDTVARALAAVGFTHGTTHCEVILTPDGPRIVEMAGRPGGARIATHLIPIAHGMDYIAGSLRIALGLPPGVEAGSRRAAAIYWMEARPGFVAHVEGLDAARARPGVVEADVRLAPGDRVVAVVDCATRDTIGHVVAEAETPAEALARAQDAAAAVRLETIALPEDDERGETHV